MAPWIFPSMDQLTWPHREKEGLETLDHFAWTLLEIRQIQSHCSCHMCRSRNVNYHLTSLTWPSTWQGRRMAAKAWTERNYLSYLSAWRKVRFQLKPRQQRSVWNFNSVSAITNYWLPCSCLCLLLTATKNI